MTRSTDDAPMVTISATLVHETDIAVLLDTGDGEIWFPKSQVTRTDDNEWTMPEWLAMKKGVI
jgi:hypothetical protein